MGQEFVRQTGQLLFSYGWVSVVVWVLLAFVVVMAFGALHLPSNYWDRKDYRATKKEA